jgi:hypothetical protein
MSAAAYPWYAAVSGEELHQGDVLEACPVFVPPADLAERPLAEANVRLIERDLVIMSQAFARFFMRVGLPIDIPPFARR